jgi:hypothetical protein
MSNRSRYARRLRNAFPREDVEQCHQHVGNAEAYLELKQTAFGFFLERNAEMTSHYHFGQWATYVWDMDAATLTFSDKEQPRVVATVEFAGSYARVPKTWMWSWANPSMSGAVTGRMHKVREHGRTHDIVPLYADHWHAPETHAHEMTAVTAYLLGARGAYRVPGSMPGTTVYMVIMDAQWVG